MSLETGTPDDTQTAGGSDGATAGTETTGAASTVATSGQTVTTDRTFTQADVDRIVQDRLARERRDRQAPERTAPTSPTSDIPSWAQPILRQNAVNDARWAVQQMREQHKDFAANETEILEMAARMAEEHPGLSPSAALQFAYRTFGHEQLSRIDIEAEKKKAADEALKAYLGKKTATAQRTPQAAGPGGTAVATTKKLSSRKDYEDALDGILDRAET